MPDRQPTTGPIPFWAWIFAVIIIILTLIQQRLSGRWVFYYGG